MYFFYIFNKNMATVQQTKPKKTSADLVAKLKTDKGVLFNSFIIKERI